MSRVLRALALASLMLGAAARLAAQPASNFGPYAADASRPQATGWTFTPTFVFATSYDDNVLIRGEGDNVTGDYTNVVNPRGGLTYIGKRTRLDASYDGAFLMYREFSTLNSYDQHASLFVRQILSRHVSLFFNDTLALVPTTEFVEFVGVPFVRTGSTIEDARGGIEVALTRNSTLVASYNFQWVQFDKSADLFTQLQGGHSHGANVVWRRLISTRTTLFADYDVQRAVVLAGVDAFNVQNASIGVEQKLSPLVRVYGAIGIAHTGVNSFGPAQTGPAWRAGLARDFRKAGLDVEYSRSYVPSYGFGGTIQNEEITGRVRLPLTRRLSAQSSVSWRSNQPILAIEPNLHTRWIEATLGYGFRPWLRLEGFYANSQQSIARPGGLVDRNRIGVQIITSNPVRVR
jgi:hypothetical protein